jgi:hypothetical protein
MKQWEKAFVDEYLYRDKGFYPIILLCAIALPAIFRRVSTAEFADIMKELHMNPTVWNGKARYVGEVDLASHPYFRDTSIDIDAYNDMLDHLPHHTSSHFVADILEVYPNASNDKGGHAIFLFKTPSTYIIIDDHTDIVDISTYFSTRVERIARFSLRNISAAEIAAINNYIPYRFDARITRYEAIRTITTPLDGGGEDVGTILTHIWLIMNLVISVILVLLAAKHHAELIGTIAPISSVAESIM